MLTYEEALERILAQVNVNPGEIKPLTEAVGHVLVSDIAALVPLPAFTNSQMDGYAVQSADILGATPSSPRRLVMVGESKAGSSAWMNVGTGECARIFTGAPVPSGADSVVPIEDTCLASENAVLVCSSLAPGQYVRFQGEDCVLGATLFQNGALIDSLAIPLIAAGGHGVVNVIRRPRVAIISTGDELVTPGNPLGPAQIYDSNAAALTAQAIDAGADVVATIHVRDDPDEVRKGLELASDQGADQIITSGGVSVGDYDFVRSVVADSGQLDFWKVAIRPGKPLVFGHWRNALFFGLPGNAVSSWVTFELFVRPAILRMRGMSLLHRPRVVAVLGHDIRHECGRRSFMRSITRYSHGVWTAVAARAQGSHVLTALAVANSLLVLPEDVESLPEGSEVSVLLLKDPLIDD